MAFPWLGVSILASGLGAWLLLVSWRRLGQAAAVVRGSEARFKAILEAMTVPCYLSDRRGNITYMNSAIVQASGYSMDEISTVAESWQRVCPDPGYRAAMLTIWQSRLEAVKARQEAIDPLEINLTCKNGQIKIFLASASLLDDSFNGDYLVTLYDITERKRIEMELHESNERFERIANNVPLVLFESQLNPDGSYRTTYVNQRSQDLYELDADAIVRDTDTFWNLIHPDDLPRVKSARAVADEAGERLSLEFRLTTTSGQHKWMQLESRHKPDRPGEPISWGGFVKDITESKTQQEILARQVQERTAQLQAMAMDLCSTEERERKTIAHDLHDGLCQTLAVARLKLSALTLQHQNCPQSGEMNLKVAEIEALIGEADQTVRSLSLQLSPAALQNLGLVSALEWLADEMQRTYGLRVNVRDDGVPKILDEAVRNSIFRATRELLINVAKHAQVDEADLAVVFGNDQLAVIVTDTGVGFNQHECTTPSASGGFGLFSVRERIGFIGGDVQIDSSPGDGSVVVLTVPLTAKHGETVQ